MSSPHLPLFAIISLAGVFFVCLAAHTHCWMELFRGVMGLGQVSSLRETRGQALSPMNPLTV